MEGGPQRDTLPVCLTYISPTSSMGLVATCMRTSHPGSTPDTTVPMTRSRYTVLLHVDTYSGPSHRQAWVQRHCLAALSESDRRPPVTVLVGLREACSLWKGQGVSSEQLSCTMVAPPNPEGTRVVRPSPRTGQCHPEGQQQPQPGHLGTWARQSWVRVRLGVWMSCVPKDRAKRN